MRNTTLHIALSAFICLGSDWAVAGELVYRPINPSYGGDPFNGGPLLNNALAQDDNEDPEAEPAGRSSAVDNFAASIDRAILNRLALELVNQAFGENEIGDGDTATIVQDGYGLEENPNVIDIIQDGYDNGNVATVTQTGIAGGNLVDIYQDWNAVHTANVSQVGSDQTTIISQTGPGTTSD